MKCEKLKKVLPILHSKRNMPHQAFTRFCRQVILGHACQHPTCTYTHDYRQWLDNGQNYRYICPFGSKCLIFDQPVACHMVHNYADDPHGLLHSQYPQAHTVRSNLPMTDARASVLTNKIRELEQRLREAQMDPIELASLRRKARRYDRTSDQYRLAVAKISELQILIEALQTELEELRQPKKKTAGGPIRTHKIREDRRPRTRSMTARH
jgi:hypothetical protein